MKPSLTNPTSASQRWVRRALTVGGGGLGVYLLTAHGMCFIGAVLSVALSAITLTVMVGVLVAAFDSAYERGGRLSEGYARSIGAMLAVAWAFAASATAFTVQALGSWTGLEELPADVARLAHLIGTRGRPQPTAVRPLLRDPREDDR